MSNGIFLLGPSMALPNNMFNRLVVPGGAGGAMAPPNFGRSVNPISTKGGRLCPPYNTGTPKFSDPPTALMCVNLRIIFHCAAVCNTTRLGVHIMLEVSGPAKLDKKFCAASTRGKLIHTSLLKQTNKKQKTSKKIFNYLLFIILFNMSIYSYN